MFPSRCHEKEAIQWNVYDSEDTQGQACPVFLSFQYQAVIDLWNQYEHHHLPGPGGVLQQTEWLLQAFKAIEHGMRGALAKPQRPNHDDATENEER